MPTSITLTVSHLPTSTSFFLAALQPLGYAYRGRSGQTIGFGPENSKAPADFWITQEVPGIPAGAAHVAFPAVSHTAVQDFFAVSLGAGGKIYGEPATRDQYGYYSAAVIDPDGNSIEAVYRPGFGEENKENDARSVLSQRSASRVPTVVSKAPAAISKSASVASSQAPTAASWKSRSPPKGDAFDRILNEARNTADVARNLVDQVRPNLHSSHSSPATPQQSNSGSNDTIVGTLLGVAAGAALHFAFASRNGSNSNPEDRDHRPSVNRSNTLPNSYDHRHVHPYAIEAPHSTVSRSNASGRYIAMEDNDYASTVRPSRIRSRRSSFDSGIGISPPSDVSKSSRKSGMKMLEAPPTSYRAPTVLTSANTEASKKSKRSSSQSRGSGAAKSYHSRRRSSVGEVDAQTVLHIQETVRRVDAVPSDQSTTSRKTSKSKASTVKPERHPLPPSRAATWANGSPSEASFATVRSSRSSARTVMGKIAVSSEASAKQRDLTQSVVGKVKGTKKLNVPGDELGPEDSVSQVSSVRPSSKRSSRR